MKKTKEYYDGIKREELCNCDYCQNFREYKTTDGSKYLTYDQYCLTCHTDKTDHPEESPGTNCTVCHQPNVHLNNKLSIHDHKFRFKDQRIEWQVIGGWWQVISDKWQVKTEN